MKPTKLPTPKILKKVRRETIKQLSVISYQLFSLFVLSVFYLLLPPFFKFFPKIRATLLSSLNLLFFAPLSN
ncbi:unknown [Crocosphaera subtropica ATCC 51142]|uniref:Uncharacterized protein n=1 Tax=Crocosphaera subtropica (strain ATCC 51142 / BH68) TaxID=43989 RepID=B1WPL4_CROS5|nr:unknown [Crocosphaera subtropica ATCC 51142]